MQLTKLNNLFPASEEIELGETLKADSCKVYVGGLINQDFYRSHTIQDQIVLRKTFMSRWTHFFTYFQVFFMLANVICLLTLSGLLFAEKVNLDPEQVFYENVTLKLDEYTEGNPPPTRNELAWQSTVFKAVIICVAPASLCIYRSRLLTLEAFLHIKKRRGGLIHGHVFKYSW